MAEITKTSEKLVIWMHRSRYTQQDVAKELGVTRQTLASKIKDNFWHDWEIQVLKRLGVD